MGYRLNRLDEPVFIEMSKPLLTEFGIHHILESCGLSGSSVEYINMICVHEADSTATVF